MQDRIVTPDDYFEEYDYELSLRPKRLGEYIGQTKAKKNFDVWIKAAKMRGEPLDHILLHGPPGLGKTTLANIISNEMGVQIRTTSGPAIERAGDLAAILTNIEISGILFIDEIHRLNRAVEEILYPAMEDYQLDLILGKGPSARTLKFDLPRFTLIGATTRSGLISSPLRARFGIVEHFDFYTIEDLQLIVDRSARILGIEIDFNGSLEIARRSRGTPRISNRLLKRVWDYALVTECPVVTRDVADRALKMLEVDNLGLDAFDRKFLSTIIAKFNGGPVGIETLVAATSEERDTIEDVYEPYLIQEGFLNRTSRGRFATKKAFEHLGFKVPGAMQQQMELE